MLDTNTGSLIPVEVFPTKNISTVFKEAIIGKNSNQYCIDLLAKLSEKYVTQFYVLKREAIDNLMVEMAIVESS